MYYMTQGIHYGKQFVVNKLVTWDSGNDFHSYLMSFVGHGTMLGIRI